MDSKFILSGSDDGSIFVYDVKNGEIVAVLEDADVSVVNCVVQRPGGRDFASSGIGHDIKVWGLGRERNDGMENRKEILERNFVGGESEEDDGLEHEAYLTPAMIWSLLSRFEDEAVGTEIVKVRRRRRWRVRIRNLEYEHFALLCSPSFL